MDVRSISNTNTNTRLKKVGILLRVSTNMQAKKKGDMEADIPEQRIACMRFIEQHPEWVFIKEYIEIGVSGFKNSYNDRDKLVEIKGDISSGVIDVLLVFMFDRLGRIEEETPLVVKSFVDMGAEVWSVKEGQRKFEQHVDGLLNYLTFWQAAGESKKTSERVTNAMTQMAEAGMYTGGRTPYGYKTIDTGRITKKRLPEKTLAIHEDEAEIVRLVYNLALEYGYGCHRITVYLNERGYVTRSGRQWGHAAISNMMNNPIYKGFKAYNRTTAKGSKKNQRRVPRDQWIIPEEPNPEWVIVSEEIWDKVQNAIRERVARITEQKEYNQSLQDNTVTKSKLLFAGFAYCGHCGSKMQTGYSPYRWKTTDGITHRRDNPVYRCGGKSSGKLGCGAKSSYKKEVVERIILEEVYKYLDSLKEIELSSQIEKLQKDNVAFEEKQVNKLKRHISILTDDIKGLQGEVMRVIRGTSSFDRDMLGNIIKDKQNELDKVQKALAADEEIYQKKLLKKSDLLKLKKTIPIWRDIFEKALFDKQKVMLSEIIERVDISGDHIHVKVRIQVHEFDKVTDPNPDNKGALKSSNLTNFCLDRRPYVTIIGHHKLFNMLLTVSMKKR